MKSKTGLIALFAKLGGKLFSLLAKLVKAIKVGKAGFAGATLASYSYMYTWKFALLIMFMLFIHESGHIWAMKRCGLKTKGIYFIPFVGGAAVSEDQFPSRGAEVFIALMGPIWGLGLSLLTGLLYLATDNPTFAAAASWMAMINLFNLLPINPLDGGRIMKSIAFSLHSRAGLIFMIIGIGAAAYLAVIAGLGLFLLLLLVGSIELSIEYQRRSQLAVMDTPNILLPWQDMR